MLSKSKLLLMSSILISSLCWSSSTRISESQLVDLFQGKDIFFDMREKDKSAGWDSAHFRFHEDGNMIGYLFSSDFLSAKTPNNDLDNGIWVIRDNMICMLWSQWNDSTENCYSIHLKDDSYTAEIDGHGLFKGEFDPQY